MFEVCPQLLEAPEIEDYACGGPRSVCTECASFRCDGASYPVNDSDNDTDGVSSPWKHTAPSDWKLDRRSITAN